MGCPPGVGDTHVLAHILVKVDVFALLEDLLLKQLDLASALDQDSGWVRVGAVHPDTGRVIAAILQTLEAGDQTVKNRISPVRRRGGLGLRPVAGRRHRADHSLPALCDPHA